MVSCWAHWDLTGLAAVIIESLVASMLRGSLLTYFDTFLQVATFSGAFKLAGFLPSLVTKNNFFWTSWLVTYSWSLSGTSAPIKQLKACVVYWAVTVSLSRLSESWPLILSQPNSDGCMSTDSFVSSLESTPLASASNLSDCSSLQSPFLIALLYWLTLASSSFLLLLLLSNSILYFLLILSIVFDESPNI